MSEEPNKRKRDSIIYTLQKWEVIFLFVYYMVMLLVGGAVSVIVVCGAGHMFIGDKLLARIFVVSISVSGMMCSVTYKKRLYKLILEHCFGIKSEGQMSLFDMEE